MQYADVHRYMAHAGLSSEICHVLHFILSLELDKCLIVKIFGYLRLSELVVASRVCEYFHSCYKSLWTDKEFFGQLETDKFTSEELGKVIKLSRLDHIRPLKQIYSGKNLRYCREKYIFLK